MKKEARDNQEWYEEEKEGEDLTLHDYTILIETEQAEDKESKGISVFTLMIVMKPWMEKFNEKAVLPPLPED